MESDLSVPPSPSSDASSPTQSPGERGAIEPMDLTDFIGSLHAEEPKSPNGSSPTQDRKASISTGSKEVDQKIQDKEWKRLLDKDYDYKKYVHADDFDTEKVDVRSGHQNAEVVQASQTQQGR